MPPSINAYPAQVLFPSPHLGKLTQSTTITWNTGANNILGWVLLSSNGGLEEGFDPPEGFDGTPRRSGKKLGSVQLGDVLEFRLRRNDTAKTLLATVKVTTGKTTGLPGVVIEANELAGGFSQGIHNLTVAPSVDAVTITFRTRQPTNPFIEIINKDTGKPVFVSQKTDKRQVHQMDMASESPGNRLAQNTQHSYRIVASAMSGSPDPSDAISTGTFRTGSRTAEIFFDRIHVRNDGDPGLKGAGEFGFTFGAGDALTGVLLGNVESWGEGGIDAGHDVAVNRAITIPSAPRGLWVQVKATENDTYFVPLPGAGLCTVGTTPSFASPGSSGGDTGDCAFATVTGHFDISQTIGGISERPFEMTTGNFSIAYDVFGRLRVEAHAGEWSQGFVEFRPLPFAQTVGAVAWVSPNKNVTFIQKQGRAQRLVMGPGGVLYHALGEAEGPWADVGGRFQGPVTAVATGPDRVVLFGLSPDGAVLQDPFSGHPAGPRMADPRRCLRRADHCGARSRRANRALRPQRGQPRVSSCTYRARATASGVGAHRQRHRRIHGSAVLAPDRPQPVCPRPWRGGPLQASLPRRGMAASRSGVGAARCRLRWFAQRPVGRRRCRVGCGSGGRRNSSRPRLVAVSRHASARRLADFRHRQLAVAGTGP